MRAFAFAAGVSAALAIKTQMQAQMDCDEPLECIINTAWGIQDAAKELQYIRDQGGEPDLYVDDWGNIYDNTYGSYYNGYYQDYYDGEEGDHYDAYYGCYYDYNTGEYYDGHGFNDDSFYDYWSGKYYDGWTGDTYNGWYGDYYTTTGADGKEENSYYNGWYGAYEDHLDSSNNCDGYSCWSW